jgi:hypothetical protein
MGYYFFVLVDIIKFEFLVLDFLNSIKLIRAEIQSMFKLAIRKATNFLLCPLVTRIVFTQMSFLIFSQNIFRTFKALN